MKVASDTTAQAERAIRPQAVVLALFGVAAGVAVVLLIGQALVRQVRLDGDDQPVLRALGMQPSGIAAVALAGSVAVVALGVIGAVVVAAALSPLAPIGPVRIVEPNPGIAVDVVVLGLGAVVLAVLVALQPFVATRRWRRGDRRPAPARASRLVAVLGASGAPPSAVVGTRLALEPGRGRTAVPVRTTLIGALVAIVALVSALTWGSSLRALVDQPRLYGWDWDTTLFSSGGYGPNEGDLNPAGLSRDRDVGAWAGVAFESVLLDGRSTPMLGIQFGKGEVTPPRLDGSARPGDREIVLGASTLERLGKHIGDHVEVGSARNRQSLRIVGTAVFPTLGVIHGDRTSLAVGAMVTRQTMQMAAGESQDSRDHPVRSLGAVLVRFKPGVDHNQANARLEDRSRRSTPARVSRCLPARDARPTS